jgi:hypothetical protein
MCRALIKARRPGGCSLIYGRRITHDLAEFFRRQYFARVAACGGRRRRRYHKRRRDECCTQDESEFGQTHDRAPQFQTSKVIPYLRELTLVWSKLHISKKTGFGDFELDRLLGLENYTFLTSGTTMKRLNVSVDRKGEVSGFSYNDQAATYQVWGMTL